MEIDQPKQGQFGATVETLFVGKRCPLRPNDTNKAKKIDIKMKHGARLKIDNITETSSIMWPSL